jgi:ABC-type transport system involved in cytochrome c biogenesis permease subunit
MNLSRCFPWIVVAAAGIYLLTLLVPEGHPGPMHLDEFARLPAVERGRVKPMDTVARTSLMIISGKQTFRDENEKRQPAIKWLLDVLTTPLEEGGPAMKHKVFLIENDQVLNLLTLPLPTGHRKEVYGFRYSLEEIRPKLDELDKQANRARDVEESRRDLFDRKLIELAEHLQLYIQLARKDTPYVIPPASAGGEWKTYREVLKEAQQVAVERLRADALEKGVDLSKIDFSQLSKEHQEQLKRKLQAEIDRARAEVDPTALSYAEVLNAYEDGKADPFNQAAAAAYRQDKAEIPAAELRTVNFEVFFNNIAPFYQCTVLYVLVFLLVCLSWVGWAKPLGGAAFWLAVLTWVVHTLALGARMYIGGRPPVTNLYSSAVFIGWGCVGIGLIIEVIFPLGIGSLLAAVLGFLSVLIAHNLATGDTLEMMQAVLDTNFWLATHVTCVTFGYAATFVAGFLGIGFILLGVFTPVLDKKLFKILGQITYAVVCFATLLSFTGTVLGGIWADQSWGRFWGWDPKENGALIIVLWNALILHARWGGMVQQRGMAVLAVAGNIVTAWSWFGVNMLGVGLHAYGFISGAPFWLLTFILSQLALIGIGMLPLRWWLSFAAQQQAPPPRSQPRPRKRYDQPAAVASN